jgi:hypothetical protein
MEEDLPLIRAERPPNRVARVGAGDGHSARGGTAPSWRCMVCLQKMIFFDRASRPVTTGPTRRRPEGPSLSEKLPQELHSVAGLWKTSRQLRQWHRAQMGVYFLLVEEQLRIRPSHGFIVCGDGTRHRIENDEGLRAWVLELTAGTWRIAWRWAEWAFDYRYNKPSNLARE